MPPAEHTPLGPGVEFDRIRALLSSAPLRGADVLLPAGDDAAVVGDGRYALSVDLAIEGVHFRREWLTGEDVGFRSVMAAVSDLAAMAADPVGVLVSMALHTDDRTLGQAIGRGVARACGASGAVLLGGDLTRSPGPVILDVAAVGRVGTAVTRAGARPGDEIWVTGRLGGAAAAVRILDAGEEPGDVLRARFARPAARVREMLWLADRARVRAAIDLSDGLGGDLGHLAAASGVAAVLDWESVPVEPEVETRLGDRVARTLAVEGGEDYELCCVLPEGVGDALAPEFRVTFGLPFTRVGWIEAGEGVRVVDPDGEDRPIRGFDHFRGDPGR